MFFFFEIYNKNKNSQKRETHFWTEIKKKNSLDVA